MRLLSTERLAHQVTNSAPSLNEDGSLQQDRHTPETAKCPTHRISVIALSICNQGTTKCFLLCGRKPICRSTFQNVSLNFLVPRYSSSITNNLLQDIKLVCRRPHSSQPFFHLYPSHRLPVSDFFSCAKVTSDTSDQRIRHDEIDITSDDTCPTTCVRGFAILQL